ncbi:MAG: LysM peptidoglycan-binding domain-containing protein [Firmicutes bacterium]|nr:LysM peptidoglycan-binding domain-containing protein [Bacillota bacterium]
MFMKNIIPFKKDVIFKTNLSEITSISLENSLSLKDDTISGDFIISGDYKVSDKSTTVEPFELNIPFEIVLDDRFETKKATVDIDDFYYEIVNNNVLSVSIDVLVDHLQEKPLVEIEDLVDITPVRVVLDSEEDNMEKENIFESDRSSKEENNLIEEKRCIEDEDIPVQNEELEERINSIFSNSSFDNEVYVTYNIFIIRDGDTLDSIMEKYNITKEELEKYNDLSNLQLGDKLIIPNSYERN